MPFEASPASRFRTCRVVLAAAVVALAAVAPARSVQPGTPAGTSAGTSADAPADTSAYTPVPGRSLLERLEAREQIEELLTAYGATLDRRDFDAFGRLFTDDAVYGAGPAPVRGRAAIQAQLRQTISANPSHLPGPDFHLDFNPSIRVDGDRAAAHSLGAYLIPDAANPGGWKLIFLVSYDDILVRQHGRWLFQQRLLHAAAPPAQAPATGRDQAHSGDKP